MFPKSKILSPNSNLATSQTVNVVISDTCKTTSDNTNKTSLSSAPCASAPLEHSPPSSSNLLTPTNPYSAIPNNESVVYQSPTDADVKEPLARALASRAVNLTETPANLSEKDKTDTIEFLKLLLKSYMNNPIKYNGYIICTVPLLEHLIELLTGCDNCEVITADPELNCCGKEISTHIVPVSKIWVKNGENTEVFKYKYSQYLQLFEEYNVSLKFVFIE